MADLQAIAAMNGAAVTLILVVLSLTRKTIRWEQTENRIFFGLSLITVLQAVIYTTSYFTIDRSFPGSYIFNVVINDILYINNAIFEYLWIIYVFCMILGNLKQYRKECIVAAIPAAIVIILGIVNLFVPVFFVVDSQNFSYHRLPLYILPTSVTAIYFIYSLIIVFRYKRQNNRYLFFPAITFIIPISIGLILDTLFYGLNILWLGAAISLTSIYINQQNQATYIDALTGVYTRPYMSNFLQTVMKRKSFEKKLIGIMLDIDHFKSINDTYGHLAGDKALCIAGQMLRDSVTENAKAFRFGGDEFMILIEASDEGEADRVIESIRRLSDEFGRKQKNSYRIDFSMGYTSFDHEKDSIDTFLNRMDQKMYEEKTRRGTCRIN